MEILPAIFGLGFGALVLGGVVLSTVYLLGQIYATYRSLVRKDLSSEQRVIYLLLIWFVPLGWLIYLLLGTERTQRLFSDIDIF